ncbi:MULTISPECIES: LuxR C-terminal-related transcriptional regulator [unclassified Blastococcus]
MEAPAAVEQHRLAQLRFLEDDYAGTRQHLELAFRAWRAAGEPRAAARAAAQLADLHGSCLGNPAACQGWVARARRVLAPVGRCVELGYLELPVVACLAPDVAELLAAADRALELAAEFADPDLEVRALADGGYALVVQGRLREGYDRLDEAMAALSAGEVSDVGMAGTAFCALLSAYDRAGDVRRAEECSRVVRDAVLDADGRPHVLHAHCRLAYGSVLCTVGRWPEGESALLEVLTAAGAGVGHRRDAATCVARLRLLQGRFEEAGALLRSALTAPSAAEPLARLHLLTGDPDLAAGVARRELDAVAGDRLRTGELLGLLVEADVARDDVAGAGSWAGRLAELAGSGEDPTLRAQALVASARVAAARADAGAALAAFRAASALLGDGRPLLGATVALETAQVLALDGDRAAAVVEARRALATFDALGAKLLADRTDALLRSLGSRSRGLGRAPGAAATALSGREREVLDLLRQGLTNAEIAARLYISARTAEHHVGRVLGKLGMRSRAEAAAFAAAHPDGGTDT